MSEIWVRKQVSESTNEINFKVVEPKLFGLKDFLAKSFLNIVTILGLARTGKSTLMNSVVGKKGDEEVFKTYANVTGCTEGVWVSNTTTNTGEDGVTIYVDTEGQGNTSVKTDYKLLMPVLLLSKVIIFNIKGRIAATDVLDELALLVEIRDRIISESDPGSPVKFGHLIIAVRDYTFEDTAERLKEYFFNIEDENNADAKKRNIMRKRMNSSFQNITVILFPYYKNEDKREDFETQVEKLKQEIDKEVSQPYKSMKIPLTPKTINDCMKDIMEMVENDDKLDMDSLVEGMQQKIIDKAHEDFKKNFSKKCDEIPKTTETELEKKLNKIKNDLVHTFEEETKTMYLKLEYLDKVKEENEKFLREKLSAKKRENEGSWIYKILAAGAVAVVGPAAVGAAAVSGAAAVAVGATVDAAAIAAVSAAFGTAAVSAAFGTAAVSAVGAATGAAVSAVGPVTDATVGAATVATGAAVGDATVATGTAVGDATDTASVGTATVKAVAIIIIIIIIANIYTGLYRAKYCYR